MNLGKKIISVAAAAALVAGAGMAASAPASAKLNKKASSTSITLDATLLAGLAAQGITVSAEGPAKWNAKKGQITFPITGVTDDEITHSGALVFTKGDTVIKAESPTIVTPTPVPADGFPVLANTALGEDTPLMNLKNPAPSETCKVSGKKKNWVIKETIRVKADVHLTSDEGTIGALQLFLSPAFTADLPLGKGVVTIVDDAKSKANKKPKC